MQKLVQVDIGAEFDPTGKLTGIGFGDIVSLVLSNAIVIASIAMFVFLLVGGFGMVAGAGQNDPEKAAKGKQAVTTAVTGYVVIFASYWIIKLIEMLTGLVILSSPL